MNGSRLIAGCFRFIFGSRYAESTRSKFGVSAYSRINTVLFFCCFLLCCLLLHENEGLRCLYCRAVELRHLFLLFTGHPVKEIGKPLRSLTDISEQVVKSKDFRRQTNEWMAVVF